MPGACQATRPSAGEDPRRENGPVAHPTQLNPNEQDTLVKQIGMALLRAMPPEWRQVRTSYRAIGRYSEIVGEVRIAGDSTAQQWSVPPEIGALFTQLRSGMYREGRGTWFNAHYQLDHPSRYNLDYDREEPRWQVPPPPAAFGDELRIYPRTEEHVPEWLVRGLAGAGPAAAEPRSFRLARTFDGPGPTGPVVNRPPIVDAEFDQLRHYLESAPVAVPGQGTDVDLLDPGAPAAVPLATHTDGRWLWPAAVGYYLREHRLPPDPQLLAHIRDRRFLLPEVDAGAVTAAAAFVAKLGAGGPDLAAQARNGAGPRFDPELSGFDRPPATEPRDGQHPDSPPDPAPGVGRSHSTARPFGAPEPTLSGSAPRGFGPPDHGRARPFGELSRSDSFGEHDLGRSDSGPRGFGPADSAGPPDFDFRPFAAPADTGPRGFERPGPDGADRPDEQVEPRGSETAMDPRGAEQPRADDPDPAPPAFELPSALDPRGAAASGPMAQPHIDSAGPNGTPSAGSEGARDLPGGPLRLPAVPPRPPLAARLRSYKPPQPGRNVSPEFGMDFPTPTEDAGAWFSGDGAPSVPAREMAGRSPFEPFIEADAQAPDAPDAPAPSNHAPGSTESAAEPLTGLAPFDPERMLDSLPTRPPGFTSFTPTGPGAAVEPEAEDEPASAAEHQDGENGDEADDPEASATTEPTGHAGGHVATGEGTAAEAVAEPVVDDERPEEEASGDERPGGTEADERADDERADEAEAPAAPMLRTFDEPVAADTPAEPRPPCDEPAAPDDTDRTAVLLMPSDTGTRGDDRRTPAAAPPSAEPPVALFQALREQLTLAGVTEADYRIGRPAGAGWTLEQDGDQWRVGWFDGVGYVAPTLFADAADAAAFLLGKTLMARQETRAAPAAPAPVPALQLPPRMPSVAENLAEEQESESSQSTSDWPIRPMAGEPPLTLFRGKRLVELAAGTTVDRYGDDDGNLTYAAGTPFASRSLVPDWVNRGYHVYRLTQPVQVLTGTAIPWFDQPGGGTAYLLPESVDGLVAAGVLADVTGMPSTRPADDR